MKQLAQCRTFWREFRDNFHTTGAVLPSSRFLARAITELALQKLQPARILEAGPGTGPFTDVLVRALRPGDTLVLVELNEQFVDVLHRRLNGDSAWRPRQTQVEVLHQPVENLPLREKFDAIVCGLPFNNFDPAVVERLFEHFFNLLAPAGTFSFFEYLAIRRLKAPFVGSSERQRLRAVHRTIERYVTSRGVAHRLVFRNVPPAIVHHLQAE
jgi:phospholipid N-methyltransferase